MKRGNCGTWSIVDKTSRFSLSLAFGFVIIESIRGVHGLVWSVLERYFAPHL